MCVCACVQAAWGGLSRQETELEQSSLSRLGSAEMSDLGDIVPEQG